VPVIEVCPLEELPPGTMRLVPAGEISVGVYNVNGELCAIEDRCSHDDGPLVEGDWEPERGVVVCPRHGATFDICSGRALTLPAYLPVDTFPVRVEDGIVKVDVR
jgi:3-phenylpropionate/trans-cinnamate dioxygenase ferredoxin subunit